MEPDISDQYESVSAYVAHRLMILHRVDEEEQQKASQKRQVGMRVPGHVYDRLATLAGELGDTPSGLAADLLELAVYEASGVILEGPKE